MVPGEAGSTQTFAPQNIGFDAVKKKSALPNSVNVGVRFGSALTMCSAFILDRIGERCRDGTGARRPAYGVDERVSPPTSRSSLRTAGSVRVGWPLT